MDDDFDDRADLVAADETIRRLREENTSLRAAVEKLTDEVKFWAGFYAWNKRRKERAEAAEAKLREYEAREERIGRVMNAGSATAKEE